VTDPVARALFSYLVQLNIVLGVFNLHPRISHGWGKGGEGISLEKDKRLLLRHKKGFQIWSEYCTLLHHLGLLSLFAGFPGALWLMIIGWFLHTAAHASYQQASIQETLIGRKVRDIMVRDVVIIPSGESVERVVNEYFLRYGYGGFPVADGGNFIGFVTLKDIKNIAKEHGETQGYPRS